VVLTDERKAVLTDRSWLYYQNVIEVVPYLEMRGISKEIADVFRLGCVTEGEFIHRLSIPYLTPGGVVGFKYGCVNLSHGDHKEEGLNCKKYLYEPGVKHQLYNAQTLIRATDVVVITEGELDAISVEALCDIPAVGYPGASTWTSNGNEYWPLCFEGIPEVIVIADGDQPGKDAAKAVAQSIGNTARVVQLGDGLDANSYIVDRGVYEFLERITE